MIKNIKLNEKYIKKFFTTITMSGIIVANLISCTPQVNNVQEVVTENESVENETVENEYISVSEIPSEESISETNVINGQLITEDFLVYENMDSFDNDYLSDSFSYKENVTSEYFSEIVNCMTNLTFEDVCNLADYDPCDYKTNPTNSSIIGNNFVINFIDNYDEKMIDISVLNEKKEVVLEKEFFIPKICENSTAKEYGIFNNSLISYQFDGRKFNNIGYQNFVISNNLYTFCNNDMKAFDTASYDTANFKRVDKSIEFTPVIINEEIDDNNNNSIFTITSEDGNLLYSNAKKTTMENNVETCTNDIYKALDENHISLTSKKIDDLQVDNYSYDLQNYFSITYSDNFYVYARMNYNIVAEEYSCTVSSSITGERFHNSDLNELFKEAQNWLKENDVEAFNIAEVYTNYGTPLEPKVEEDTVINCYTDNLGTEYTNINENIPVLSN